MGLLNCIFGNKIKKQKRICFEKEARHEYRIRKFSKEDEFLKAEQSSITDDIVYLAVFSASWCGPSRRFINDISEAGINNYAYIDVDKEDDLSVKFSIRSVPTTLLIDRNDNVIKKWVGYDQEDKGQTKFVNFIKSYKGRIVPYKNRATAKETSFEGKNLTKAFTNNIEQELIAEDHRTSFYRLEDIKSRPMGEELMLAPYDVFSLKNYPDSDVLPAIANSDKINRFLPNLGFKDKESTQKHLIGYIMKTEAQLGVTYFIRYNNIPIGMIFVNTPIYNKKAINLAIWTIDFFISEMLEHEGIVYNSILRVLNEIKTVMNAKVVYALVDQDNHDCINVIGKGLFEKVNIEGFENNENGLSPFVYKIDVSNIQFIKS